VCADRPTQVDEETVVVGHSTGALLIMRLLEQTSVYR
jgi:alpha-beta hydrolase superfamily lysophospholipase